MDRLSMDMWNLSDRVMQAPGYTVTLQSGQCECCGTPRVKVVLANGPSQWTHTDTTLFGALKWADDRILNKPPA